MRGANLELDAHCQLDDAARSADASEVEPQRELQDARVERGGQTPEGCAVDVVVFGAHEEVGVIEGVERFGAKLQIPRLLDLRALDQAQVDVPETWAADGR